MVSLYIERKEKCRDSKHSLTNLDVVCFFTDGKPHKAARELGMIILGNYAPRPYMTWLAVTLSVLDMIIV